MAWEKQLEMAQESGLLNPMGDLNEAPGSWLSPGPALVIGTIWRVNQKMKNSVCVRVCVYVPLPPSLCNSFR